MRFGMPSILCVFLAVSGASCAMDFEDELDHVESETQAQINYLDFTGNGKEYVTIIVENEDCLKVRNFCRNVGDVYYDLVNEYVDCD